MAMMLLLLRKVKKFDKIGHSSRSSSIQRSKTTVNQSCLVMFHDFRKSDFSVSLCPFFQRSKIRDQSGHRA